MVKDKTFSLDDKILEKSENLHEIVAQAKEFELDTVLFYEFIENLMSDEPQQKQLQKIIEEERKHAKGLSELLEMQSKPEKI